jgi:2-polyprenyl-3-methyl-5-hydroxy-6-metoxy-1,4-benzoquinol methylase
VFRNWINASDLHIGLRAVAKPTWLGSRLHLRERDRVLATWDAVETTATHWYNLPLVVEHRLRRAADGKGRDHVDRFVATHLGTRDRLCGLSIGCGNGVKEIRWAATGRFARIDAFDIAPEAIRAAKAGAAAAGLSELVRFAVGDLFELDAEELYDVVIFEDALHHLSPLDGALERVERLLRPGGHVVINEYVGPNRQQMRPQTVRSVNALLGVLPERYRERAEGRVKAKVAIPSKLRMILRDPSEAPESASILRLMAKRFDLLELTKIGGTLVYPLLDGIAQNFHDSEGRAVVNALLDFEDALVDGGDIESDYVFATYRKRRGDDTGQVASDAVC